MWLPGVSAWTKNKASPHRRGWLSPVPAEAVVCHALLEQFISLGRIPQAFGGL